MITLNPILTFLNKNEKYAIVGVSRDKKKYGRMVFDSLKQKGYQVYAVNPSFSEIEGEPVFASLKEVPKDVKRVIIVTPKSQSASIVQQASECGMTHVWIQQTCDTPEALEIASQHNLQCVSKHCIFMVAEPVTGIHKFHRSMKRFFGGFPR